MENKVKMILILSSLVLFHFAGSFEDVVIKSYIISTINNGRDSVYVVSELSENTPTRTYKVYNQYDKDIVVKGDVLLYSKYNDMNIPFWIFFVVVIVVLVIGTFTQDDDFSWCLRDIRETSLNDLVRCEEELGVFYYFIGNRLITTSNTVKNNRLVHGLGISKFSDLKKYPLYKTKSKKRNDIFNSLLS